MISTGRMTATAIFLAIAVAATPVGRVAAGSLSPDLTGRIDDAVRRTMAEEGTPSASIAIVRDGRLVYAASYGLAQLQPAIPATPETRYQIASISKMFTAQALLLLEQDGKLDLDAPLSHWFQGLTGGDRITVRQLLQHTSGFADHYPQPYPAGPRTRPTTPDAIIAEWGRHPLLFEPGTRFRYSNLNYVIAGRIVEKVTGESLFSFLRRRVFDPLGMTTVTDLDENGPDGPNVAAGYLRPTPDDLMLAPLEGRGWSFGAGEVVATATDLARWDEAFLAGRCLSPQQAKEETTPPILADGHASPYALGLFITTRNGGPVIEHDGQGLGFLAINRIFPDEHAAIVVLTNDSGSPAHSRVADRLAYLVVPSAPADIPARTLFSGLQAGAPDRSRFSPDLDAYLTPEMIARYAAGLAPLGPPDTFGRLGEETADGLTTRIYDVGVKGGHLRMMTQTLPDGRLESLDIRKR